MSAVFLVKRHGIHGIEIINEPRFQQSSDLARRRERKVVVGDRECNTCEGVRQALTLRLAVVGRSGSREAREACFESSVNRKTLGVLRGGLAVGGAGATIVGIEGGATVSAEIVGKDGDMALSEGEMDV